ncbi:hypothetical protein SMICM17S_07965 [Streptomyces microflavus]
MRSRASEPSFIALFQEASSKTGSGRNRKSTLSVISERTFRRVCARGAMACHLASSKASGAQGAKGALSQGAQRSAKSFASSMRMWSPLIASHFFRSKRAGFGCTSATSKAATISSIEKTSRSAERDQPSRER